MSDTWKDCVLGATWLSESLKNTLHYAAPLPVQQAVVPTVVKALLSDIPMDVSLTAPTGSGKTLCYLLPILRFIEEQKRGIDDTRLRCLVLVPTKVLGQQVFREVQQLIRSTTITAAHWCGNHGGSGTSARDELRQLIRLVRHPGGVAHWGSVIHGEDDNHEEQPVQEENEEDADGDEDNVMSELPSVEEISAGMGHPTRAFFFKVDILVTTPQRLLQHLDRAEVQQLSLLSSLKLLVMDEADQVLGGHFANAVTKVVERFEAEKWRERQWEERDATLFDEDKDAAMEAGALTAPADVRRRRGAAAEIPAVAQRRRMGEPVLHKILCSATLSSRIARISEIRLRNCVFYALDSNGKPLEDAVATPQRTATGSSSATGSSMGALKRKTFSLPPRLQEHVIFVEENYRHAVLLKLIRQLVRKQNMLLQRERAAREKESNAGVDDDDDDEEVDEEGDEEKKDHTERDKQHETAWEDLAATYPPVESGTGDRILIFCSSADEARVVAHFLHAGGIPGVLEFTTAATDLERRRVLLMQSSSPSSSCSCIVASDALMRGIDIPGVGHVVMYHPPESLAQLIHRAGRTARAMRSGHLHLLLTKTGVVDNDGSEKSSVGNPRAAEAEGQMAQYYQLSAQVARTLPIKFERSFFKFRVAPHKAANNATNKDAHGTHHHQKPSSNPSSKEEEQEPHSDKDKGGDAPVAEKPFTEDEAEWWVEEANRCLDRSQHQLQRSWTTVMEAAQQKRQQHQQASSPHTFKGSTTEQLPTNTHTWRGGRQEGTHQTGNGHGPNNAAQRNTPNTSHGGQSNRFSRGGAANHDNRKRSRQ